MASSSLSTEEQSDTQDLVTHIDRIRILGTGIWQPDHIVKNEDLEKLGCDSDWIVQRTGILARHHAPAEMATSDLAVAAARQCLERSETDIDEIDLIIVATMTPDHYTPSTACMVQKGLGAQAAALDLNAACSGFVYALVTGSQFIKSGCSRKTLVIGADKMTMVIDPADKKTFPLFGDGAGAAIIELDPNSDPDQASGILSFQLASEGELGDTLLVPACGSRQPATIAGLEEGQQYLKMDGRSVFKWAVRLIPEIVGNVVSKANMTLDDIDLVVFHQANKRIIDAAVENLDLPQEKVFMNLDRWGNTSAASIPISLYEATNQGRVHPGSNILLAGFGAGLTWGAAVIRW